jgi:hypothetical protein
LINLFCQGTACFYQHLTLYYFKYFCSFLLAKKEPKKGTPSEPAPSGSAVVLGKILKQLNSLRSDSNCFLTDFSSAPRLFQWGFKDQRNNIMNPHFSSQTYVWYDKHNGNAASPNLLIHQL